MTAIKSTDKVKKIIETWYEKFPEKFNDNKDILKWIKEFPVVRLISAANEKQTEKIKQELIKIYEKDRVTHIKKLKNSHENSMLHQSSLHSKLGKVDLRIKFYEEELKRLEKKYKELRNG